MNFQVEIDSLRGKLSEAETTNKKLQEQLLVEKLKRVITDVDVNHHSEEIIKGIPLSPSPRPSLLQSN